MRDREILEQVRALVLEAVEQTGIDHISMDLSDVYWEGGCLYATHGFTVLMDDPQFLSVQWLDDMGYNHNIGTAHKSMPRLAAMMLTACVHELRSAHKAGKSPKFSQAPEF